MVSPDDSSGPARQGLRLVNMAFIVPVMKPEVCMWRLVGFMVAALTMAGSAGAATVDVGYAPTPGFSWSHLDVVRYVPRINAPYSRPGTYHFNFSFAEPLAGDARGYVHFIPYYSYYTRGFKEVYGNELESSFDFVVPAGITNFTYDVTIGYPQLVIDEHSPPGPDQQWYFIRTTRYIFGPDLGYINSIYPRVPFQVSVTADFAPAYRAAVPEPSSWALMLTGFGLIGGALRRRFPTDHLKQSQNVRGASRMGNWLC